MKSSVIHPRSDSRNWPRSSECVCDVQCNQRRLQTEFEPGHVKMVLITYTNSEGSGETAHQLTQYRELEEASDKGRWKSGPAGWLSMRVRSTMLRSIFSCAASFSREGMETGPGRMFSRKAATTVIRISSYSCLA